MEEKTIKNHVVKLHFIILLIIALLFRLPGITWGLPSSVHPYSYHPDEGRLLMNLAHMDPFHLNFDPGDFAYPIFHTVFLGGLFFVLSKIGILVIGGSAYYSSHPLDLAHIFLVGRIVTILLSIVTTFVLYATVRRIHSPQAGFYTALFFAIAPQVIIDSHYMTLDIPMLFWMSIGLYCCSRAITQPTNRWFILAGIAVGLAGATKYPGLLSGLFVVGTIFYLRRSEIYGKMRKRIFSTILILFDKRLWIAGILAFLFFLPGIFYMLLDPIQFSRIGKIFSDSNDGFSYLWNINHAGWLHNSLTLPYVYYLLVLLPFILGIGLYVCGLLYFFPENHRKEKDHIIPIYLLGFFTLAYFLIVGKWVAVIPRYALPLTIPFVIFAGIFAARLSQSRNRIILVMIIFIAQFGYAGTIIQQFTNDTVDTSFTYVYTHIPADMTIMTTLWAPLRYSPLYDPGSIQGTTFDNDHILALRVNNATEPWFITPLCIDLFDDIVDTCKKYSVITMFDPTAEWFTLKSPDIVILSSLQTTSDEPPAAGRIIGTTRTFYKTFREEVNENRSPYVLVKTFTTPYYGQQIYTTLDPRLESEYASPRIEVYVKKEKAGMIW